MHRGGGGEHERVSRGMLETDLHSTREKKRKTATAVSKKLFNCNFDIQLYIILILKSTFSANQMTVGENGMSSERDGKH